MQSFTIIAILAITLGFASASLIGDGLYGFRSTLNVVRDLCFNSKRNMTDELALEFFNCYDAAPEGGRAIYTACQLEQGSVMNTTAGIKKTCDKIYTFPVYALCLSKGFKAANISTLDAVVAVNACEEQVLGIAK